MKNRNTRRGFTQNVVICSPCGESVAAATKEGLNWKKTLWPLLPRLTAVLPPQGREITTHAFTLIELLVVVLIIGILVAVAVPQYQKAVEKSRVAEALSVIGSLRQGIDLFVLANGFVTQELIGGGYADGSGVQILDTDMETGLNCTVEDGHKCASKHFAYDSVCLPEYCFIKAWRCLKEDCSDWRRQHYCLEADKSADTNKWTYSCYFYQDKYENLCKSLQAVGYTAIDGRPE